MKDNTFKIMDTRQNRSYLTAVLGINFTNGGEGFIQIRTDLNDFKTIQKLLPDREGGQYYCNLVVRSLDGAELSENKVQNFMDQVHELCNEMEIELGGGFEKL